MNEVLKGDEVYNTICKQELHKTIEHVLRVENLLHMKKDRVYVKWKCFYWSFRKWLDKTKSFEFL